MSTFCKNASCGNYAHGHNGFCVACGAYESRIAKLEAENRDLLWALVVSTNPPDVTITDETYRKAKELARDMAEFVYEGRDEE